MKTTDVLVFLRRQRSGLVRMVRGADEEDWRVSLLSSSAFTSGKRGARERRLITRLAG